jgi:hypothetical protein
MSGNERTITDSAQLPSTTSTSPPCTMNFPSNGSKVACTSRREVTALLDLMPSLPAAGIEKLLTRDLTVLNRVDSHFLERDALAGGLGGDFVDEVDSELTT